MINMADIFVVLISVVFVTTLVVASLHVVALLAW
jgi:hypothetical protein